MSWSPVPVPVSRNKATAVARSAATVSMRHATNNAANAVITWRMAVILRPGMLGNQDWLKPGARVDVQRGFAEHAGKLRISKGGDHVLRSCAGGIRHGQKVPLIPQLLIDPIPGTELKTRRSEAVVATYGDGWVEVELPEWAGAAERRDVQPKPAPQPFRGMLANVPDPRALKGRAA